MISENPAGRDENERQYKVLDQTISMHSLLRDRMDRRAFWLNTGLVTASLFLAVLAFVGDDTLGVLGLNPERARFVLCIVTVVILACSITEFRVNWQSVASRHSDAATRLRLLKAKYRKSFVETGGMDARRNARLSVEYSEMMAALPPIPERWFVVLKSDGQFKRVLSARVSKHQLAPLWFLRLQLRFEGIRDARQHAGRGCDVEANSEGRRA